MAVAVGNVRVGDDKTAEPGQSLFDVSFSLVVNNVARGAYGAALLNAELYDLHIRPALAALGEKQAALHRAAAEAVAAGDDGAVAGAGARPLGADDDDLLLRALQETPGAADDNALATLAAWAKETA